MDDAEGVSDADERFRSLMEGIRTTLPGVQVLFGFLLAIPFQTRITALTTLQQRIYLVAFVGSALSSLLLIAPSVHQRVRAPRTGIARRHMRHVRVAAYVALAGTVLLFVAMTAAVHLVVDVVFGASTAISVVIGVALLALWAWFYLPLVSFSRSQDS
jgi:hypothetical protein